VNASLVAVEKGNRDADLDVGDGLGRAWRAGILHDADLDRRIGIGGELGLA
jgi:hypothetical protein